MNRKFGVAFEKKRPTTDYFWRLFQWTIFVVVMILMVHYLRRYWRDISSIEFSFNWFWGFLAAVLVLVSNVLQILLFKYFLQRNNLSFSFLTAWRTFCVQQIGKYVPGKIVGVAALSYALKEAGLSGPHALATVFIFNIVALLSSLFVGLFTLPAWASRTNPVVIASFVATAAIGIPAVCTHSFWSLINLCLLKLKRPPLPSYPSRKAMLGLMLGWIFYWLVLGTGMFAVTHFLIDVPLKWFPLLVPAFSLACFISNISFIAPAGFGVREGLLIGMVGMGSTAGLGALFAGITRIVMLLNDVIMIAGSRFVGVKKPGSKRTNRLR